MTSAHPHGRSVVVVGAGLGGLSAACHLAGAGYDVTVCKIPMGAVGAPTVYGDRSGMVKIVGDKKYGEILGGHIVSVKAADLIQELVNALELEGGYPEVARTIHPHPAFAEAVMEAARATDGWLIHG